MLTTHAQSSNKKLIGGFLLLCLFGGLNSVAREEGAASTPMLLIAFLALLAGLVLWVRGCWQYAQGKGYPGAVGLMGLVFLGLIVLFLLPDQYKCCKEGGPDCTHGRERTGPKSTKDWSSRAA